MAEKTAKKNTKGTKKAVEKKVTAKKETKKAAEKKVSTKKETKKVTAKAPKKEIKVDKKEAKVAEKKVEVTYLEKKDGKIKVLFNKILNNKPFAYSLIIILILLVLLTIVFCTKRIPKTSEGKQVVASIKGKTITADDLYLALKDEYGTAKVVEMIDSYISSKEVKLTKENEEYLQDIVDQWKAQADYYGVSLSELVASYGLNISSDSEFYEYLKKSYSTALAVAKYIGDEASEDELKNFYKDNYSDEITARHILIEVDDDEEKALELANELIDELKTYSKDELEDKFIILAKQYSDDTGSYSNGGLIENFTKATVVSEFFEAANKLKDGEFTAEPVKSSYGYHIIYKVSAKPVEKYEDIKDKVKQAYGENKLNSTPNLQTDKWNELRESYKLKIVDSDIKAEYDKKYKNED